MHQEIIFADYANQLHAASIIELMSLYALDPMGGGKSLPLYAQKNLVDSLGQIEGAFTILAFIDKEAVGLVNCMPGFSTFSCKPLINIHDVIVKFDYRGQRLTAKMLRLVEKRAVELGCCKLTLEVLEGNKSARKAYKTFGFRPYELDPLMGQALFWDKMLPD